MAIVFFAAFNTNVRAQSHSADSVSRTVKTDTVSKSDTVKQTDLIDIAGHIIHHHSAATGRKKPHRLIFAIVPSAGYTLSTGLAGDITGNVAFYTVPDHSSQNLSSIYEELIYDTRNQKISIIRSDVWFGQNEYNLISDLRWEEYPEQTYGLGTMSSNNKSDDIDYKYVKAYPTIYKKINGDFYWGVGYNFDYHYDITQKGNVDATLSDYSKYGFTPTSTSSGVNVNFLYDSRKNAINPQGGGYAWVMLRQNSDLLGSDANWSSLFVDLRRYYKLSSGTRQNILAFWAIAWLTKGYVPYLDLPATGTDMYNNTGRGYVQGRFRGRDMLYLEGEYRFGITNNGLFGGVVFANGESFTEFTDNTFKHIAPAAGAGIRIKVNKHSNTNVCFDYAVGQNGSKGLFINLGEVF